MSSRFHIATDEGLISVQVQAQINLAELHDLAKAVLSSEDYDAALPLLIDLRGMRLELERQAAEPFNRFMISSLGNRGGSTAVVIDGGMSSKLSAAVYWLACAVGGTEVFDDYDHALKWLIRREFVAGADQPRTASGS